MIAGLRAWWRGLRHLEHRGYVYIWANVLWAILSLPVVTAPAAWAGLIRMSYVAQRSPNADLNDFWEGFRENLGRGAVLVVITAVLVIVNVSNLLSYREQHGLVIVLMRGIWLLTLVGWFTILLYLWPIFYTMSQPTLWGAGRNAAVMILLNPTFTLGLLLGVALIIGFSMIFFAAWLLLTAGALASIANSAVLDRLEAAGYRTRSNGETTDIVSL